MRLKAGTIFLEDREPDDAVWDYEPHSLVTISHDEFVYVSIEPDDLIAVCEAIKERLIREKTTNL